MASYLITGATGLIGQAVIDLLLRENHSVKALVRDPKKTSLPKAVKSFAWAHNKLPPAEAFKDVDVVIHLAGEGIANGRWTKKRKQALYDSRILGTRNLVQEIVSLPPGQKPKVFISGSAVGIYGSRQDEVLDESASLGSDFLAHICKDWEAEALKLEGSDSQARVILLRTSTVLAKKGGALSKMPPVVIGRGENWMSWIHLEDMARLILWLSQNPESMGPYNMASPDAKKQKDFIKEMVRAKKQWIKLYAPEWTLKLALGEMSELLLASQKAIPKKAQAEGFDFKYPTLDQAMRDLLG